MGNPSLATLSSTALVPLLPRSAAATLVTTLLLTRALATGRRWWRGHIMGTGTATLLALLTAVVAAITTPTIPTSLVLDLIPEALILIQERLNVGLIILGGGTWGVRGPLSRDRTWDTVVPGPMVLPEHLVLGKLRQSAIGLSHLDLHRRYHILPCHLTLHNRQAARTSR